MAAILCYSPLITGIRRYHGLIYAPQDGHLTLDASDLKLDDAAAAIEEVKRLRALLQRGEVAETPRSRYENTADTTADSRNKDLPSELADAVARHKPTSDEATVLKDILAWAQSRIEVVNKQPEQKEAPNKRTSLFAMPCNTIAESQSEIVRRKEKQGVRRS